MKTTKKFLLSLLVILLVPAITSAATAGQIINNIASVFTTIGVAVIIIAWMITALLFLLGSGNPNLVGMGKKAAYAAIIGTAIYVVSSVALNITSNALLRGQ